MNAQQLLKKAILLKAVSMGLIESINEGASAHAVDSLYDEYSGSYVIQDAHEEIRCSGVTTNLRPSVNSRCYEVDSVAMQIDGYWVEWPFLYGGGKHGQPEGFDWIGAAKIVNCIEQEVRTIKRTFTDIEHAA